MTLKLPWQAQFRGFFRLSDQCADARTAGRADIGSR
jgi:hypothetical protein